jgi:cytochrome P450
VAPKLDEVALIDPDRYAREGYPHDEWTLLRRQAPVYWFDRSEGEHFWALTRHEDIVFVSKRPDLFISGPTLVVQLTPFAKRRYEIPKALIDFDPPKHGPQRQIISKGFTPRALRRFHADIERIAKGVVDALFAEGDEGECDFVEKISAPLPIAVIGWLLGVPEPDWPKLFHWTNRILGAHDPEYRDRATPGETVRAAHEELFEYFAHLVALRRREAQDDLVSVFAHAEVEGQPLSDAEEEILRWTSPLIHFARTATRDVEIRDQKIAQGEIVALFYPSANRDEDIFDAPFEFRVDRKPNRHLAFGIGEHFCAGAHVARLEIEYALRFLLPRIAEIELAAPPSRLRSNLIGGIKHLPIRYKLRPERFR